MSIAFEAPKRWRAYESKYRAEKGFCLRSFKPGVLPKFTSISCKGCQCKGGILTAGVNVHLTFGRENWLVQPNANFLLQDFLICANFCILWLVFFA